MVEPWDFAIIAEAATSHMMTTVHVLVVGFCDGRGDKTVPCRQIYHSLINFRMRSTIFQWISICRSKNKTREQQRFQQR